MHTQAWSYEGLVTFPRMLLLSRVGDKQGSGGKDSTEGASVLRGARIQNRTLDLAPRLS